jgi:two-component system response regulator FixJ
MMADRDTQVIAVVDDDDAVRESLTFLLTVSGHRVDAYRSAADFLERCDVRRVAGLILDHHMPRQTGLELLAQLRRQGLTLPVLLVTGSPTPDIMAQADALGVDRVLEKPVSDAGLMEFLDRVAA